MASSTNACGSSKRVQLSARRQAGARTEPRALERGRSRRERAASLVPLPSASISAKVPWNASPAPVVSVTLTLKAGTWPSLPRLAPGVALAAQRHARMLGPERQHMLPSRSASRGTWREFAQRRRGEDRDSRSGCRRPTSASRAPRSASRMVGTSSLRARGKHGAHALQPPQIAQHGVGLLDALQRQPARTRRHAGIALAHDQPLALVVDDDGRGGGARALEGLHVAHVDVLSLEAGADHVAARCRRRSGSTARLCRRGGRWRPPRWRPCRRRPRYAPARAPWSGCGGNASIR